MVQLNRLRAARVAPEILEASIARIDIIPGLTNEGSNSIAERLCSGDSVLHLHRNVKRFIA
jgi:hypothetical protein